MSVLEELELKSLIRQVPKFVETFSKDGLKENKKVLKGIELRSPSQLKTVDKTETLLPPPITPEIINSVMGTHLLGGTGASCNCTG